MCVCVLQKCVTLHFVNVFLICCLQPFFDKLMKRKWLNNTEAFEAIEASTKQHFKKFKRMDPPPYQVQNLH